MKIRIIPNILKHEGRKIIERRYVKNKTLKAYLKGINIKDQRIIVSGRLEENLNYIPKRHDDIVVTPKVEGPVAAFFAWAAHAIWVAALAHPFVAWATVLTVAYSAYSYLTQPKAPAFNFGSDGLDKNSPTYSWEGGQTVQSVGTPRPIVYGRHRVWGNIINQYQTTDGNNNLLHLLILLCEGKIHSISDVQLNDNPIENYESVDVSTRLGLNDQTVIDGFGDLHNIYDMDITLTKNQSFVYTTDLNDVEAFGLYFSFPSGLFSQNDQGGQDSWSVTYQIRYKIHGTLTWTDLGTFTIDANNRSNFKRIFNSDAITAGRYDIEVTKTSDDSSGNNFGDFHLTNVDEIRKEDIAYVNRALLAVNAVATNQLQGARPNVSALVEGIEVSAPRIRKSGLDVAWEDYYWDSATSKYRLFSDNSACDDWDGVFVDQFCANPIWCRKDLLLNKRYGLGEFNSADDIDDALYLEMSRRCEEKVSDGNGGYEKRYRLDVVIDSRGNAMDILTQLDTTFAGNSFYSQGKVLTRIDMPQEETMIYGMGNILENSFSERWKSDDEIYNQIEVQFNNKDKNYDSDSILVIDSDALDAGEEPNPYQVRYYGTSLSGAIRFGHYMLKVSKYIDRIITIKSKLNAIVAQLGDRIGYSHDVPGIGQSGRIESGSTDTVIKLDQPVALEAGKTYKLRVAFMDDDTLEEQEVTDGPGTYSQLTVASAFSKAPAEWDVYSCGEEGIVVEPLRLIAIERNGSDDVTFTAVPYIEGIYDDDALTIPETKYSVLDVNFPVVQNLSLTEMVIRLKDGTIENTINVWFSRPNQSSNSVRTYSAARIYISDNNGDSWTLAGETTGTSYRISNNIKTGGTYKIAVVSVTKAGEEASMTAAAKALITIQGKAAPPSNVTGFDVSQQGNQLKFKWDPIEDGDLARYEIRKGTDWETGQVIAEKVDVTEFPFPIGSIGEETYMIKAFDTSGNPSNSPSFDTITVTPPPDGNFVQQIDPWAQNREYLLSGIDRVQMNLFDPSYNRDVFVLMTATKWADLEGQNWQGLNLGSQNVVASGYIQQTIPIDLGVVFTFNLISDLLFINGSIAVEVNYSVDGTTWSGFAALDATTNYKARYLLFKYTLTPTSTTQQMYFYAGTIFLNAPQVKKDQFRDVAISSSGTHLTFTQDFSSPPRFTGGGVINGVLGFMILNNKTNTGVDVLVIDKDGIALNTAEIDAEFAGV